MLTGGIGQTQGNLMATLPQNVKFVMGPNGQMIAIEKPPFVWKHFFIGGGIPFAIFFVPLLILMIGDVLDYDDYEYEDHLVTMTKDENSTIYRGQLTVEENYYLLESCEFYSPQDTISDIYCDRYDDYKANINMSNMNLRDEVVGYWNNDNGTVYFDTGIDYGEELEVQMEFRTDADSNDFFMIVGDISGATCCLGLLLSIIFLIVGFSQGRDDVASYIEKQLKTLFVQSMKRVERHVCNEGRSKSLNRLLHHLGHAKKTEDNHQQLQQFLEPLLDSVFQRVPIEDRRVLNKLRNKIPLNALEKIQARSIYLDHQNLKKVSEQILEHAQQDKTKLHFLENVILKSRVQVAGDVLENVIFKYHFERNFEKKTHQIQLPISKSLSIPRPSVIIRHQPKSDLWKFLALVPRTGTKQASRGNALEMFEANMTEGIARCVFSGYIGFTTREMTSFQKEAARMATPVTNNPFASDDALNLAQSILAFLQPHS